LIGPILAGKSTVARLLSQKLGIRHYVLDDLRWKYYQEIGYDSAYAEQLRQSEEGFPALYRYSKPFEAYAVERVLSDVSNGVIDFGGGNSVYEDPQLFERVQKALAPYQNVIMIFPCPNLDEAVQVIHARLYQLQAAGSEIDPKGFYIFEHFTRHPSNWRLAKQVVYTQGKTPEETCAEVLAAL
jgi:shikimate kinase